MTLPQGRFSDELCDFCYSNRLNVKFDHLTVRCICSKTVPCRDKRCAHYRNKSQENR